MRFKDQVVVVTGSARGIGFATASLAAKEGAKIVIHDLDPANVDAAVKRIQEEGGQAMGVVGDVTKLADVRRNVDEIMKAHNQIDVLVNNAGIISFSSTKTLTDEVWRREIEVCLTGSFFWAQAVGVTSMIPRRKGAIVNLGSGAALAGLPNCAAYVAAKHGVIGLTKSLAVDWGQYNVRVNCLCPGFTWTDMPKAVAKQNPELMAERERRIPLGHGAQPEDQARAILFLASSDADNIHGHVLNADGGTMALSSGYAVPRDPT